ncbi:MAG: 50S ribosomal protein L11 methyltransferase [Armatimonadetes bacterium]|nr:50S ribosomal protein L11 methyltransferase [Armatimonadota bacterium]
MSVWTKVTAVLPCEPEDWSVWAHIFESHGLPGTLQTDDPPTMSAYLPPGAENELASLSDSLRGYGATEVESSAVEEEDWAESWKQFFKPKRLGEFVVKPTWEDFESRPGDRVIELDPGQAFGTGDHPTTRMCMELLARADCAGKTVADIGCGSGILSIAASMLGAKEVFGVDIDPVSVTAARENALRNRCEVTTLEGKGFAPLPSTKQFDIVVSNIISAALISLAPEARQRIAAAGQWIVSGIIKDNWPDVRTACERVGFQLREELEEGEWVAATFSL